MVGILPFLIQWLALSQYGQQNKPSPYDTTGYPQTQYYSQQSGSYAGQQTQYYQQGGGGTAPPPTNSAYYNRPAYSSPLEAPKSYWTLLTEFQQLPEDEIENFLPQICNILIEREDEISNTNNQDPNYGLYEHFERILIDKCAGCLPFGLRVCNLLKAAKQGTSEGVLRNVIYNAQTQQRTERLRQLQEHAEYITSHGSNLPSRISYLRSVYYRDLTFMLDTLARVGKELRSYPAAHRNHHLRAAISQFNNILYARMASRGQAYSDFNVIGQVNTMEIPIKEVASMCPAAAAYSLHLPLQHCKERASRILRFVEAECEVLPSKERCPYLVVAELLEQPFSCKSDELYTQGHLVHERLTPTAAAAQIDNKTWQVSGATANPVELDETTSAAEGSSPNDGSFEERLFVKATAVNANVEMFARPLPQADLSSHDLRGGHTQAPPDEKRFYDKNYYAPPAPYTQRPSRGQVVGYDQAQGWQAPPQQQQMMRKTFMRGRSWEEKQSLIRSASPFGHLQGWRLKSFIVKAGDDLRKEMLAMQIIEYCQQVFKQEGVDIVLRPYQIISTGHQAGLVEFLEGARSIDRIKKSSPDIPSLKEYFEFCFGASYSLLFAKASQNFVKSLAGYSLITYLLQVRDRHNANIMIDEDGSIIHIDFGFILGESPGFNINFENAPFKLTREYIDLLGGIESEGFKMFEELFVKGFFALQKHADGLCAITQLFYGRGSRAAPAEGLRTRLSFATSQEDVLGLIRDSVDNWRTKHYDWYQQNSNNILS